jgi:amino acid permease
MGVAQDSFLRSKYFWGPVITTFVTFPLSLAKMISMLRYTSLLSFLAVVYVTFIILSEFFALRSGDTTHLFDNATPIEVNVFGIFEGIPLIIFAYTCHPNVVPIYSVPFT